MKSRLRSERNRPSSLVEPFHKGVVQCMPLKSYNLEIFFAKQALIYKVAIPVYQSKIDSSFFFTARRQFSTSHTCELPKPCISLHVYPRFCLVSSYFRAYMRKTPTPLLHQEAWM